MNPEDRSFLREFFRAVTDRPLEPDHEYYVPLYENTEISHDDPVDLLARGIEWTPGQSVQLLSGFRGTGKSTELRRLRQRLQEAGYLVALCDLRDYLNLSTPLEVSDFLVAAVGAFSDKLKEPKLLGEDLLKEGYWERFASFLTKSHIELGDMSVKGGAVGLPLDIKASLKTDPTFKKELQERMAGHLSSLVSDVEDFLKKAVQALKKKHGTEVETVLLVDSVEQIRGTFSNAEEVQKSVESTFAVHADKLHLPHLHVVYTVPPYLKVRYPNLGGLYAPGGTQVLPAVRLRDDESGEELPASLEALRDLVGRRGDWQKLLGERETLDLLIHGSGGHLRDLLRLLAEVIRRAGELPVGQAVVNAAIDQVRNEFLPIANADAVWLHEVAKTHSASLEESDHLPDLSRFLDTHMLLCYHNGHEWYDVHPLIDEVVREQAEKVAKRGSSGKNGE